MALDINSVKGQKTLEQEQKMISYISDKWKNKGVSIIQTLKTEAADCDGFLIKDNQVVGLFESKCRDLTLEQLKKHGTWLITYAKLEKCRELSLALKVPFLGFLYLVPDDIILSWKIAQNGKYCFEFETKETRTQRTVNGGSTIRVNAFLNIDKSTQI